MTTQQPRYLYELLRPYDPPRQLRQRGMNLLQDSRTNLNLAKRAFCHAVATVWNNLPQSVISDLTISLGTFKSRLKTKLYSRVFRH